MNRKIPLYSVIILMMLSVIVTFNVTYLSINEKHNKEINELFEGYDFLDSVLAVDEIVRQHYIGEIDDEELKEAIIEGYLSGIGDKYGAFMTKDEYASYTQEQNGNAVGIGVNVVYSIDECWIQVISVYPDSPAFAAGIEVGDRIVSVDGAELSEIGCYEALNRLVGEEGTQVTVTLERDGSSLVVTCRRQTLAISSVSYHVFAGDSSVGVVRLSEFNATTPEQFSEALEALKKEGCTKFVFDVRNNGGGSLSSIVKVLDTILPEGPLAHLFYETGQTETYSSDNEFLDAPVVVLTNEMTASAAELFASALRDYNAQGMYDATLVGTTTYGKGVVQSFFALPDGAMLKISCGRYDPPYGENFDGVGVTPDIELPLSEDAANTNFYLLTDETDNQLIHAVELLKNKN